MNPIAIPVEILEVSGIANITKKAGKASSNLSQVIPFTAPIIKLPTTIKAGEVMADTSESVATSGPKNDETMNKIPTVNEVNPVRPPATTVTLSR